jgi:hypothetical protein
MLGEVEAGDDDAAGAWLAPAPERLGTTDEGLVLLPQADSVAGKTTASSTTARANPAVRCAVLVALSMTSLRWMGWLIVGSRLRRRL